jgi:hypothetical protein
MRSNAFAAECRLALGGRDRLGLARVDLDRLAQRARQRLVTGLDDVMVVDAVQALDMQPQPGILCEGAKPFAEQFGIEIAELGPREVDLPDQPWPVRTVQRGAGQRLVHRDQRAAIARDALAVAQRLRYRLADGDAGILGGVVEIDMQVALGPDRQIDQAVARDRR